MISSYQVVLFACFLATKTVRKKNTGRYCGNHKPVLIPFGLWFPHLGTASWHAKSAPPSKDLRDTNKRGAENYGRRTRADPASFATLFPPTCCTIISLAEKTKKQHTKHNTIFVACLVDADINILHEDRRDVFLGADRHDKLHPETAVSRAANLLAFARHALANGMPIHLRELPHGIFSSYIATKIADGEHFYGTKGRQKMRLLASAHCYLYSSANENMPDEMRADIQMTVKSLHWCWWSSRRQ